MKKLFLKIKDTLLSTQSNQLFASSNIKKVQYIDLYKGQINDWGKFEIHKLPAVLFGWSVSHDPNNQVNRSIAIITLYLVYEQFHSTSSTFDDTRSLEIFDFADIVNQLVEGVEAEKTGKLQLISEESFNPEAIEKAVVLTYQCPYTGKANCPADKWDMTPEDTVDVDINGNLVKTL